MKQCPDCKREMKEQLLYCPFDGQKLVSVEPADRFVGLILDDKYRLEEKIGEGGMGKVYKATHIHMAHTLAIKVLHPHLSSDHTALERFRREAQATAHIRHPNAVTVSDFGVSKETGIAYLAMEFLEGLELREKIQEKKLLDYEESFLIVEQTCRALQAAHAKGIIHRDLKPDNIWLLKAEEGFEYVKVLDFGIAKLKSSNSMNLTQHGMIVGTPYYMSPEQCKGEELDSRSDIYSLGVILYEMLTGNVPFVASTPMGVALKHTQEPPLPPRELRADLPASIEAVILRALEKRREDRQSSALELAQEFEAALYQAGIELKTLGTRTPHSGFSLGMAPSSSLRYPPPSSGVTRPADVAVTRNQKAQLSQAATLLVSPGGPATDSLGHVDQAGRNSKLLKIVLPIILLVALVTTFVVIFSSDRGKVVTPPATPPAEPPKPAIAVAPEGMVLIPAGTFTMGYNQSTDDSEKPEHPVEVKAFFMDKNEVTVGEYYEFMKAKNLPPPAGWKPEWKEGKFTGDEARLPVVNVTWFNAKEYAQWAGKRLPTEKEWEYAARGSDKRLYPWGNEFDPNYVNGKDLGKGGPMPVGSYPAGQTPLEIMDMSGNVAEWTESDSFRYPDSKSKPKAGKIIRGGSFSNSEVYLMATTRVAVLPDEARKDTGFRCVKDVQ
jgi:eukaryotic-like serine/threonine-protein kinase